MAKDWYRDYPAAENDKLEDAFRSGLGRVDLPAGEHTNRVMLPSLVQINSHTGLKSNVRRVLMLASNLLRYSPIPAGLLPKETNVTVCQLAGGSANLFLDELKRLLSSTMDNKEVKKSVCRCKKYAHCLIFKCQL